MRVWKDHWLNDAHNPFPTGLGYSLYPDLLVKDLFIAGTKLWDVQKIQNLVHHHDVSKILNIRPSWFGAQDVLFWFPSKSGHYTVKTGYYIQRAMDKETRQNQVPLSSQSQLHHKLISKVWKLNLPPKLKIFWWKILHNGLPVADNLRKRGINIYSYCQACGEEIETVQHMLMHYRVAKEIWSLLLEELPEFPQSNIAIFQFFQYLMDRSTAQLQKNLPFFIGWRIWKMRNKLVFENERDHIVKTAHAAILDDRVWEEAMRQNTLTSQVIHRSPQISLNDILQHHTCMYCIVDASWKSPVEKAGIGWSLFSQ